MIFKRITGGSPLRRLRCKQLVLTVFTVLALLIMLSYKSYIPVKPNYLSRNLKNGDDILNGSERRNNVAFIPNDLHKQQADMESGQIQEMIAENGIVELEATEEIPNRSKTAYYNGVPVYYPEETDTKVNVFSERKMTQNGFRASINGANIPEIRAAPFIPEKRVVHFDLKGAPPKVSYLEQVFQIISKLGATHVLLEYEDMFPYANDLSIIKAKNAYSLNEIKSMLSAAGSYNLEVIPLVQTFGHLELALKLKEFSHLREVDESPQAICPSKNSSLDFVTDLIEQIIAVHQSSKFIHIGCDEVFYLGECNICKTKNRNSLFLQHIVKIAQFVRNKGFIPIVWHDMMIHMTFSELKRSGIGNLVEPMIWVYAEDIYRFVPETEWKKFSDVFSTFWSASAYKGAFGETLILPEVKRHIDNNANWLAVMRSEGTRFKNGVRGLVLTGWQRYDHFAVLCELLPGSLPSLAMTLSLVSNARIDLPIAKKVYQVLECINSPKYESFFDLTYDPKLVDKLAYCFFPGASFFKALYRLEKLQNEVDKTWKAATYERGWMTDYNLRYNFSEPSRVDEITSELNSLISSVTVLAKNFIEAMDDIFDVYTVQEWLEQKILPLFELLGKLKSRKKSLKSHKAWKVRPFTSIVDWKKYDLNLEILFKVEKRSDYLVT
ncbi:hexosaminidase D-like [Artemia franciscana]|uniref:beta-N-acetylhexosaminidase n=1 Tax=Artemia franciscana TaxID=6661 RepID=A0AA88I0A5_ARTSF|nr:hypothetical protein QYM36_006396 [Artemia franciscana]KAK2717606.1 hypothetical protein QYM36_006396 [Artemia franciscana]